MKAPKFAEMWSHLPLPLGGARGNPSQQKKVVQIESAITFELKSLFGKLTSQAFI